MSLHGEFGTMTKVSPGLTQEYVSGALTKWFGEPVAFTHWEYVSETGKGDSYLSEVIRIKIYGDMDGTTKHVQVVLKTIPKNVCRRLTFRSHDFFRNEITFYEKVLPELLKFQTKQNVREPFDNHAKLFLTYMDGVNDVICLEDASLKDFGSAVRQEGIDIPHCEVTLKSLAKYHALSFAMRDQDPERFNAIRDLVEELYYDPKYWDWYQKFWHRICGIAIDAVDKEYPDSDYAVKVKGFAVPGRYEDMVKAVRDQTNGVISHGDCWTNNFLYKYVGGNPVDALLIDFQLTRCATPVLDISFFIYACTDDKLRQANYDDLLQYYYDALSTHIRDLGSDPNKVYSRESFLAELKKYSYFGLAFSFESTPFIILAPDDAVNMEMEGDEKKDIDDFWQIQPFKTKEGRLREANNVVHCVDRGFI